MPKILQKTVREIAVNTNPRNNSCGIETLQQE